MRNRPSLTSAGLAAGAAIASFAAASAHAQFQEPDANALFTFQDPDGSSYGWAVAEMEDIDGDGAMESIIGSFGSSVEVRSGATGVLIHRFTGGGILGFAVADAGDVDGDGLNDIAAGAPAGGGVINVYSGADGSLLHALTAPGTVNLGTAVASAGDVNEDGHADILGADRAFNGFAGQAYVFSGADGSILRTYTGIPGSVFGAGAALTPDIDGDGFGEHIISSPFSFEAFVYSGATGDLLLTLAAPAGSGQFGVFFVDGLRDVDGDDVPDLYVGDFSANPDGLPSGPFPGAGHVYSGADGSLIRSFRGEGALTGLGPGRGAGDVDNDGHEDLIIGAFNASTGVANGGQVNIYSGQCGELIRSFTSAVPGEQLGFDCVEIGDVSGDGVIDFILSAANNNTVYIGEGRLTCRGDLDRDGRIWIPDLLVVVQAKESGEYDPAADLDCDGDVDNTDVALVASSLGACELADGD